MARASGSFVPDEDRVAEFGIYINAYQLVEDFGV
jgi:hypothetical protein